MEIIDIKDNLYIIKKSINSNEIFYYNLDQVCEKYKCDIVLKNKNNEVFVADKIIESNFEEINNNLKEIENGKSK